MPTTSEPQPTITNTNINITDRNILTSKDTTILWGPQTRTPSRLSDFGTLQTFDA
jgi:hypothetical protein